MAGWSEAGLDFQRFLAVSDRLVQASALRQHSRQIVMGFGKGRREFDGALVDEIAMLTTLHDKQARRDSYTLIAQAFGIGG